MFDNPLRVLLRLQSRRKGYHSKNWKTLTQKRLKKQEILVRAEGWKNKPLHGQFLRQTEEIRDDVTWDWLRNGDLKKETEGMITAAQDQALRTNAIKAKVEKQSLSPFCRMCVKKDDSMGHLVGECSKLTQTVVIVTCIYSSFSM